MVRHVEYVHVLAAERKRDGDVMPPERFLFRLAVSSARKRLVLLAARRDVVNDRARLLSPYLVELLEARDRERGGARRALGEEDLLQPDVAARLSLRAPLLGVPPDDDPPVDAEEVLVRAIAFTNPKSLENVPDYHARFEGIFDLASSVDIATERVLNLIGDILDPRDDRGRYHETGGSG